MAPGLTCVLMTSYEALDGGTSNEALQDFCGGIVEVILVQETKEDIIKLIETAFKRHSFICAAVEAQSGKREAITKDGIVHGHAYTVTGFKRVDIRGSSKPVPLVRIRNPWGSETEWNGAWSDGSKEWSLVSDEVKRTLELKNRKDGEFWMNMVDFKAKFYKLDVCNLSPSFYHSGAAVERKKWNENDYNGKWIPWATAGGCGDYIYNDPFTYATNPQFIVEFDTPDEDGDPEKCTVLIGLLQKNRRAKKKEGVTSFAIGYSIYSLADEENIPNPLDLKFFKNHQPVGTSGMFSRSRVVNARFELAPGKYCIVPSTFKPNEEGEFVIRVFSESSNRITENGGVTKMDDESDSESDSESDGEEEKKPVIKLTREQQIKNAALVKIFESAAGEDQEIGWAKLRQLLDTSLKKEFKFDGFNREVCRSMVALLDKDRSGKIGITEFLNLWTSIQSWKDAFKKFDEDRSNNMNSRELREALKSVGINLSNRTLETLILRYGDDKGVISFEDFIMCTVKLNAMIATFKASSPTKGDDNATFKLEDWLEKTIYS